MSDPSDIGMPIGAVTQLTGITSHTLRKWESRYHAIEPVRTETGRRLYRQEQVQRLLLLRDLVRRGHQISRLADMSDDALRALLGSAKELPADVELERAMVIGEGLPTRLAAHLSGRNVDFETTDAAAWLAEATDLEVSGDCALMVELPTLSERTVAHLTRLRSTIFPRVVVVYGFANQKTLRTLMDGGVVCLKSSATVDELVRNLEVIAEERSLVDLIDREALPSHRYAPESIAQLAALSPKIQCECPNHIAQLVMDISAFEQYSMECEDQDPAERALHARLRLIAAHARALFEEAVAEVAAHEGLSLSEL